MPLFVLHLIKRVNLSGSIYRQRLFKKAAQVFIVILITGGQIFTLVYTITFPARNYTVNWENISIVLPASPRPRHDASDY